MVLFAIITFERSFNAQIPPKESFSQEADRTGVTKINEKQKIPFFSVSLRIGFSIHDYRQS